MTAVFDDQHDTAIPSPASGQVLLDLARERPLSYAEGEDNARSEPMFVDARQVIHTIGWRLGLWRAAVLCACALIAPPPLSADLRDKKTQPADVGVEHAGTQAFTIDPGDELAAGEDAAAGLSDWIAQLVSQDGVIAEASRWFDALQAGTTDRPILEPGNVAQPLDSPLEHPLNAEIQRYRMLITDGLNDGQLLSIGARPGDGTITAFGRHIGVLTEERERLLASLADAPATEDAAWHTTNVDFEGKNQMDLLPQATRKGGVGLQILDRGYFFGWPWSNQPGHNMFYWVVGPPALALIALLMIPLVYRIRQETD